MDANSAPHVLGPEGGDALWGVDGSLMTIKVSAHRTGAPFSLAEEVGQRSEGTPLHRHAEDEEAFYVLEGEMTFYGADERPIPASAGTVVHIPAGAAHAFRVDSETARYLILTTAQHERFYRAISDPARETRLPEPAPMDMERIEAACAEHNVEILGPPPGASA